jgi:hypothetical protein
MVRRSVRFAGGGALVGVLLSLALVLPSLSAAGFAAPAFNTLWSKTDANPGGKTYVWGPSPFTDGLSEDYKEAGGGKRVVQYFDKGRMELGANSTVTAGLLTVELITGRQQNGDSTFVPKDPAKVPVAGDPDNTFPTYADLAKLQAAEQNNNGKAVTKQAKADGTTGTYDTKGDAQAVTAAFDDTTKHNLPKAFADFRNAPDFGGLSAIGLAITEPVWATVKVAGTQKDVLMQGFERRVLTYTPSNPDGFKVEYGNIGRAYYAWRYPSGTTPAPAGNTTPAPAASATPPPAASAPAPTTGDIDVIAFAEPSTPKPDTPVNLTIKLVKGGAPLANTPVHVDWKFEQGVPAKASDVTTNKDGVATASIVTEGAFPGTTVQIIVTVNGQAYPVAGLAIT